MQTAFRILAVCTLFLLLTSCQQMNLRVSTMWTDVPEMAGYVEKFNASQKDWQILIEYRSGISEELLTPGIKADLVVSNSFEGKRVKSVLSSMSFLFDRGGVTKSQFYQDLLKRGSEGDTPLLVPISFNLPITVFKKSGLPDLEGLSLSLDRLRELNRTFNTVATPGFRRMAFSPRWGDFSWTALEAQGFGFTEDFRNQLIWDGPKLAQTLGYLDDWIAKDAKGHDAEKEFTRKYLQTNPLRLIQDGRIQFSASTIRDFLSLPFEERRGLDFRYPEMQTKIPAEDDIVWAAVPSSAVTRGAAEAFLEWFFHEDVQKQLVLYSKNAYFRSLGIAGGFSSLESVNNETLPQVYPDLDARIPPESRLSFPELPPADWHRIKSQVLTPWLQAKLTGMAKDNLETALSKRDQNTPQH